MKISKVMTHGTVLTLTPDGRKVSSPAPYGEVRYVAHDDDALESDILSKCLTINPNICSAQYLGTTETFLNCDMLVVTYKRKIALENFSVFSNPHSKSKDYIVRVLFDNEVLAMDKLREFIQTFYGNLIYIKRFEFYNSRIVFEVSSDVEPIRVFNVFASFVE